MAKKEKDKGWQCTLSSSHDNIIPLPLHCSLHHAQCQWVWCQAAALPYQPVELVEVLLTYISFFLTLYSYKHEYYFGGSLYTMNCRQDAPKYSCFLYIEAHVMWVFIDLTWPDLTYWLVYWQSVTIWIFLLKIEKRLERKRIQFNIDKIIDCYQCQSFAFADNTFWSSLFNNCLTYPCCLTAALSFTDQQLCTACDFTALQLEEKVC